MSQATLYVQHCLGALRTGDLMAAQQAIDALAALPDATEQRWLMQAAVARAKGSHDDERAALVALLRDHPRHLHGLLARGDLERRARDDRAASRFYQTALNVAAMLPTIPPALQGALRDADQFREQVAARYAAALRDRLGPLAKDATQSPRISYALDMMMGRAELFIQQPSVFYFPGLAARPFFDRTEFDWAPHVESASHSIRAELAARLAAHDDFTPYVQSRADAPIPNNPLLDSQDWGALHLWRDGQPTADAMLHFPDTLRALTAAPMPVVQGRAPMALFSRLKPGAHILPHVGMLNTRLICHLPLVVPDHCAIRVGAETRQWTPGQLLILDDSIEHEAWNRSTSDRIILLFEIWRPDISLAERDLLTAIYAAVDAYEGDDG